MSLFPIWVPDAGVVPVTMAFTAEAVSTTSSTLHTFAGVALSTSATDRKIVVTMGAGDDGTGAVVNSLTVGGVSATKIVELVSGDKYESIWVASVPSGTTGDIVATWSISTGRTHMGVWATYGMSSTANATGTSAASPATTNLNVPAGGAAFGASVRNSGTAVGSITWTNLTEAWDRTIALSTRGTGAGSLFATEQISLAVSVNTGTTNASTVFASFGTV